MKLYQEKKFTIPALHGISQKNIEEHLKLYGGYVKHTNHILERIDWLLQQDTDFSYEIAELQRRFAFEFDGMRNHEYYFASFEGGPSALSEDSLLRQKIIEQWGSFESWLLRFQTIAKTRGIGWAILYYDHHTDQLINAWIDEQHLGHLNGLQPVLCLDMWEHSFVADYHPSGKVQYIEDFFKNINWNVVEKNFIQAKNK